MQLGPPQRELGESPAWVGGRGSPPLARRKSACMHPIPETQLAMRLPMAPGTCRVELRAGPVPQAYLLCICTCTPDVSPFKIA